jgi:GTP cyclohydrolase I
MKTEIEKPYYHIHWEEVFRALLPIDKPDTVVYGIPKGGMIAAGFLKHAKITHDPFYATLILDDIIDSGETMEIYEKAYPNTPKYALVDKTKELALKDKWVVFPWESQHPKGEETIQNNITRLLQYIGEDPKREGLLATPDRVVRSYDEIFSGYFVDPASLMTTFMADGHDEIVLVKDIEMYSMCEHHMLPFFGKAHVAYIPNDKLIGVSKLARLVDVFSRRLQIQERIGDQVTSAIEQYLKPKAAACVIEATHMCMRMRGVAKQNSVMVTSSMKGAFMTKGPARQELMQLIKG